MDGKRPHILILDNSPTNLGTKWFPKWFRNTPDLPVSICQVVEGERIQSLLDYDAIIMSGSPASATDEEGWIYHEIDLVLRADQEGIPVLGVCFGAQLLARAYYGKGAIRSSDIPEFGWQPVERVGEDVLFTDVPHRFVSYQFHMEEVCPQDDMKILARNDASDVHGYRVSDKLAWGLQFHLEVTPSEGRDLLESRKDVYRPLGFEFDTLMENAQPNEASEQLFHNFIEICRREMD